MTTPPSQRASAPRIYYAHSKAMERQAAQVADRAADLGFDHLLISQIFRSESGDVFRPIDHDQSSLGVEGDTTSALSRLAQTCRERGLRLLMDLDLQRFDAAHGLVAEHPDAFGLRREAPADQPLDPRRPAPPRGMALARLLEPAAAEIVFNWITPRLDKWLDAGLDGVRLVGLEHGAPDLWRRLIAHMRARKSDTTVIADTPGMERQKVLALAPCGFDALISSVAWWDGRAPWLAEEHEDLRPIAPLLAQPEAPFGPRLASRLEPGADIDTAYRRALRLAAATGAGLLMPMGFEWGERRPMDREGPAELAEAHLASDVRGANLLVAELTTFDGMMRQLTGPAAAVSGLLRASGPDGRNADAAILVLVNRRFDAEAEIEAATFLAGAGAFGPFERLDGATPPFAPLAPGEVRLLGARRSSAIKTPSRAGRQGAKNAAKAPRLVIEEISPQVSGGFAAKSIVGEPVKVQTAVYGDGHEALAVELRWRATDQQDWAALRMEPQGNDIWTGSFPLERMGRHQFVIEAWIDRYGSYHRDLTKKIDAGVAQTVDLEEGRAMVAEVAERDESGHLAKLVEDFPKLDADAAGQRLLDPETARRMDDAQERAFCSRSEPVCVDAERREAQFASWYELFPRSQTDDPDRHGTFDDVIARMPGVRAMGFDVLYFPPIHPIGRRHRKGRNNSLTAGPNDPGSPYAIGSEEGGHDAIHPELGSFDDFRRLIAAAEANGLEIALDFAIQCSPDHPWIKEHPGWFDWRSDGTIKYAENPPKKYQDIVNVDFYKSEAIPDLWLALRDVVLLWVSEGVRTFRVDNPHTKPFAFWEWMIREVRAAHPDVIFLSEAFTRPRVMYRLAKIGFSQSYTYFTWRHTKAEFTEYLTELSTTAPKEFFRPNFFVSTPDINPYFLQTSGRAGFLIRAVLAATLSGLWGVYSGFELLESDPVPCKEEFKDSEKYEIRPRDWNAPHGIVPQITQLNRLRKAHPALQTHLNVHFLPAQNDNILFYAKTNPDGSDLILVAVNLDPHGAHEADVEAPFWRLGLGDDAEAHVEDLLSGQTFSWRGKWRRIALNPDRPYAIYRMEAPR